MIPYNHFEYCQMLLNSFSNLNFHSTLLKAFGIEQLEQFRQQLSSVEDLCLVAIDAAEQNFTRRDSDTIACRNTFSIVILAPASVTDTEQIFSAVSRTNTIANMVVKRIFWDSVQPNSSLYSKQPSDVLIQGVGPIGDNFFGTLISFKITTHFPYSL